MHKDIRFSERRPEHYEPEPPDPRVEKMLHLKDDAQAGMALGNYRRTITAVRGYFRLYNELHEDTRHLDLDVVRMYALALRRTGCVKLALTQYILTTHDMPGGVHGRRPEVTREFYREALECAVAVRRSDLEELFRRKLLGLMVHEFGLRDCRTLAGMLELADFLEGLGKHKEAADYRFRTGCGAVRALWQDKKQ